jgi:hypothetical protein
MEKNLKLVCPKCGTPHQPHSPHTMDADGFERCEIRTIMEDKGWCYECSFFGKICTTNTKTIRDGLG